MLDEDEEGGFYDADQTTDALNSTSPFQSTFNELEHFSDDNGEEVDESTPLLASHGKFSVHPSTSNLKVPAQQEEEPDLIDMACTDQGTSDEGRGLTTQNVQSLRKNY